MVPEWSRWRRRLCLPEAGKKTSPGRLAATGELLEHAEAASQMERARGPPFIARRGRFRGGGDKISGDRRSVGAGGRGGDES